MSRLWDQWDGKRELVLTSDPHCCGPIPIAPYPCPDTTTSAPAAKQQVVVEGNVGIISKARNWGEALKCQRFAPISCSMDDSSLIFSTTSRSLDLPLSQPHPDSCTRIVRCTSFGGVLSTVSLTPSHSLGGDGYGSGAGGLVVALTGQHGEIGCDAGGTVSRLPSQYLFPMPDIADTSSRPSVRHSDSPGYLRSRHARTSLPYRFPAPSSLRSADPTSLARTADPPSTYVRQTRKLAH